MGMAKGVFSVVVLLNAFLLTALLPFPVICGDTLQAGGRLYPEYFLESKNGVYSFIVQGNAAVNVIANNTETLWTSDTGNHFGVGFFLMLNPNGAFYMYAMTGTNSFVAQMPLHTALCPSKTVPHVIMQNDGNAVGYCKPGSDIFFQTGTSRGP
ncbi:hypothetical protein O6H91_Y250800 [Diphasiastrum complanatum]|nr:hypothetical protein O6H91_Y250800 [Diphasiastrum complanatum]